MEWRNHGQHSLARQTATAFATPRPLTPARVSPSVGDAPDEHRAVRAAARRHHELVVRREPHRRHVAAARTHKSATGQPARHAEKSGRPHLAWPEKALHGARGAEAGKANSRTRLKASPTACTHGPHRSHIDDNVGESV